MRVAMISHRFLTWFASDLRLEESIGQAIGEILGWEALEAIRVFAAFEVGVDSKTVTRGITFKRAVGSKSAQGEIAEQLDIHAALLPTINILPWLNWGRAQESYGEDPFFSGRMGTALVRGVQYLGEQEKKGIRFCGVFSVVFVLLACGADRPWSFQGGLRVCDRCWRSICMPHVCGQYFSDTESYWGSYFKYGKKCVCVCFGALALVPLQGAAAAAAAAAAVAGAAAECCC